MDKNKVLVFHYNHGYELVEYGYWTFSDYAVHYLSPYIFEDEDGNTVDESGHFLFSKDEEDKNDGWFAFDDHADGYRFVPLEKLDESGYEECRDCFWEGIRNGNRYAEEAYKDMRRMMTGGKLSWE